ncbi:MAG TPA: carbon monoxide dehydrogenase subunit G [Dehalococcoidia bacterium]|nr:carbon monoxide dehydrogenase subunit G [Dehalococcoidia bacterium]
MEISGQHQLPAPPEAVWQLLHDVAALRQTVPGCQELETVGEDSFAGAASVGIGVIKGLYKGTMRLVEQREPSFARIEVLAKSSHAEIKGSGEVSLEPTDGGTLLRYTGEARMSGPLAAVGQRLLPAAAKAQTETFFKNVEAALRKASGN